jgi:hypothetical protein
VNLHTIKYQMQEGAAMAGHKVADSDPACSEETHGPTGKAILGFYRHWEKFQ